MKHIPKKAPKTRFPVLVAGITMALSAGMAFAQAFQPTDPTLTPVFNTPPASSPGINITADYGTRGLLSGTVNSDGVIPLLRSINEKLAKSNIQDTQTVANQAAADMMVQNNKNMADAVAANTMTPSDETRACLEIDARIASMTGGGSAGGYVEAAAESLSSSQGSTDSFMDTRPIEAKRAAEAVERKDFCSASDVRAGVPACETEGSMPNADVNASSLVYGYVDGGANALFNASFDPSQVRAAQALRDKILPDTPVLPKNSNESASVAVLYAKRIQARYSLAALPLNDMIDLRKESARYTGTIQAKSGNVDPSSAASGGTRTVTGPDGKPQQVVVSSDRGVGDIHEISWAQQKEAWGLTFGPQYKFPDKPSMMDLLKFRVYNSSDNPTETARVYGAGNGVAGLGGMVMVQKEIWAQQALTNKLLYLLLERQMYGNAVAGGLLAQSLDPRTIRDVSSAAVAADSK